MDLSVGRRDPVENRRGRGDQVHVELALEPLLDNVHMEQAQETATKTEPQRGGRFRLEEERGVVETQFVERVAQLRVLVTFHWVQPREHHRLHFLEACERLGRWPGRLGNRIADLRIAHALDSGDHKPHFPDAQRVDHDRFWRENADLLHVVVSALRHQTNLRLRPHLAVDNPDEDDDAAIGIVPGIEDEGLERRRRIPRRRRHACDDGIEDLARADAFLRTREDGTPRIEANDVGDLAACLFRLGTREIDLVNDRNDVEVVIDREVGIRNGLRFDSLRGVDEQQCSLACGERAGDFVGEIDMSWRINEVEDIPVPVGGRIR